MYQNPARAPPKYRTVRFLRKKYQKNIKKKSAGSSHRNVPTGSGKRITKQFYDRKKTKFMLIIEMRMIV